MKAMPILVFISAIFGAQLVRSEESKPKPATLDDLKKLPIACFVPSYLPKGFKLKKAEISYDEGTDENGKSYKAPLYSIEWSDGKGTFSIESAAEGIGDRNIMETEDSEEAEIQSPLFGRVYIICTPKGKEGAKKEILTNWVEDEQIKLDQAKSTTWHGDARAVSRIHWKKNDGRRILEGCDFAAYDQRRLQDCVGSAVEASSKDFQHGRLLDFRLGNSGRHRN